jgi:seryl-tRNA synthetase
LEAGGLLDLRRIREDPVGARTAIRRKHEPGAEAALDQLLAVDSDWRACLADVEALRSKRNTLSAAIGDARRTGGPEAEIEALLAGTREVRRKLDELETDLARLEARVHELLLVLPNYPDPDVPDGPDESANVEVRREGEPPIFDFIAQPHWDLGSALGLLDFEGAARTTGSRFTVFRGVGARLVRALIAFMIDLHVERHGCTEVLPPFLVRSASMLGTGQLPKFAGDAFAVSGTDLWLTPTAEVPVTNLYREQIVPPGILPLRHVAYTPCWRAEAGAAGRDTRGLIRQHQFDKVEIVHFVAPEDSPAHLNEIVGSAEAVLRALGLAYRVVEMCSGDVGFAAARKLDLEVWLPSYGRYVEISSCSNFRDFQARRAGIRFRRSAGAAPEFVHTLNGSALAVGRTIAALLENCQRRDGSVRLPEVLRPYMGDHGLSIGTASED